jgi:hypothetical protein
VAVVFLVLWSHCCVCGTVARCDVGDGGILGIEEMECLGEYERRIHTKEEGMEAVQGNGGTNMYDGLLERGMLRQSICQQEKPHQQTHRQITGKSTSSKVVDDHRHTVFVQMIKEAQHNAGLTLSRRHTGASQDALGRGARAMFVLEPAAEIIRTTSAGGGEGSMIWE